MENLDITRLPKTAKAAKEIGSIHYFTGKKCKQGHLTRRYTNTCNCCECHKIYNDSYKITPKGRESRRNNQKKYRNPPEFKAKLRLKREAIRKYHREYSKKPEQVKKVNEYRRKKRKSDCLWKLRVALRTRMNNAIKGNFKKGSAIDLLGCNIQDFKKWIESQFQPGMSWNNWSRDGWHIDHKRPLKSFDLTDRGQLSAACHYTNLQPLWALDNLKKGTG